MVFAMSKKPSPSEPDYFGAVFLFVMAVVMFGIGFHEITTQEANVRYRKHVPLHHVTGTAAVLDGIWQMVVGVMLFGGSIKFDFCTFT